MSHMDLWIRRHVRRLEFGRYLGNVSEFLGCFFLGFGMLVLISKLLQPQWWPHILWVALCSIPVALLAGLSTRRRRFTPADSVVFLDNRLRAGGLLMTLHETDDQQWDEYVPQADRQWRAALPRIRPLRFLRLVGVPLVFATGCCLVPLRAAPELPQLKNTVSSNATAELKDLLELVAKQRLLDEQHIEQLRHEIDALVRQTAHRPLTHENWETVDALREKLGLQLDSAARRVQQGRDAAQAAFELADASPQTLDPERLAEWEAAISEALKHIPETRQSAGTLPSELQELLKRAHRNGQFQLPPDLENHSQALEQLAEYLEREAQKLEALRAAAQPGSKLAGDGDPVGPIGDGTSVSPTGQSPRPGQGGVDRGRADAQLTYGDESESDGTRFQSVVLPPGFLDRAEGDVVRVTKTAPNTEPAATATRSQQRQLDPASGRTTWTRTLQPKHRRIVRHYFNSK